MAVTTTQTQTQTLTAPQQLYAQIKNLEGRFPIPTPVATVEMGTFNATTGTFSGLVSKPERFESDEGAGPTPKPPLVMVPPVIDVNAVNLIVRFRISTPHGGWKVTANGQEVSGTASQHSITVDCGTASSIEWNVAGGGNLYRDQLVVNRPLIVGAGAFTVPALPVALLYEPPPRPRSDRSPDNLASYAAATTVGTVLTSSFTSANSSAIPVPSRFESVNAMRSVLNGLATTAGGAGLPAVKSALKGIADALGQAGATATQGTQVTGEHTLAVLQTFTQGTTTGENDGGPGIGDQIQFLRNARLVWLASGGVLRLTLIGHDALVTRSVATLKANRDAEPSGIGPAVVDALLALDPFVAGGPQAVLPADRFVPVETYDLNGGDLAISASQTISQTDLQARTRTTMRVDDMRAGALAFLGIGVPQTETVTTTLVQRSVAAITQAQTATAGGQLFAGADERYVVEVFYDRVFGTFAFRTAPPAPTALVSGVVSSVSARVASGERISLLAGGRRFVTVADGSGRWAFHAPDIRPGTLTIKAGDVTRAQDFSGEPVRDIELRLA